MARPLKVTAVTEVKAASNGNPFFTMYLKTLGRKATALNVYGKQSTSGPDFNSSEFSPQEAEELMQSGENLADLYTVSEVPIVEVQPIIDGKPATKSDGSPAYMHSVRVLHFHDDDARIQVRNQGFTPLADVESGFVTIEEPAEEEVENAGVVA